MRIKKLELKNFRGFEDLTIDFPEGESGLAVFVGVNGSGKTSVLDAIKNSVFILVAQLIAERSVKYGDGKNTSLRPSFLGEHDIRVGSDESHCSISFEYNKIEFNLNSHVLEGGIVGTSCDPPIDDNYNIYVDEELTDYRSEKWDASKLNILRANLMQNPPCFISYPTNRFVSDDPSLETKDITELNPIDVAQEAFFGYIDFNEFFEWYRNTEDYENEQIRFGSNKDYRHKGIEGVRDAISKFLPSFSKLRVQRQPKEEFIAEKDGIKLSINNLSQGERLVLSIIGDIARRLSISYPKIDDLLSCEGVVIIDEIEQHLHPAWQRTIIPNLRRTFPNIQFILTTHSPQVISTLQRENVFILDNFQLVPQTPHTYGRDSNSILYDIFGVEKRPAEAKQEFAKLYRLMDDPAKVSETANLLRDVEAKYGYYDEEVVRARGQFQFLNEA